MNRHRSSVPQFGHLKQETIIVKMISITRHLIAGISKLFPNAIFYKQTSSKVVSLTIDDVGGVDTLQILDAIDSFNQNITNERERIKATFFVITDYLDDSKTIRDEILNRGHEIGNHGQKEHRHFSSLTSEFRTEINQAHEILSSSTINSTNKKRSRFSSKTTSVSISPPIILPLLCSMRKS